MLQSINTANGFENSTELESTVGNPSLLVSENLPRWILDFTRVASSPSANETVAIDEPSPSGRYWVAVYANRGGAFGLQATPVTLDAPEEESNDFFADLMDWLLNSGTGMFILIMAAVLFACIAVGCVMQHCAPKCCRDSKLVQEFTKNDAKSQRRLDAQRSMRSMRSGGKVPPPPGQRARMEMELVALAHGGNTGPFTNPMHGGAARAPPPPAHSIPAGFVAPPPPPPGAAGARPMGVHERLAAMRAAQA
jgi:hypothetical protein